METIKRYENYPIGIIILSNLFSFVIYGLSVFVLLRLGIVFTYIYILYIFVLEYRLIKNHCTNCIYWGKSCGFGKGKVSSWIFKQGDTSKFCNNNMTWWDMIPDLLVTLIPMVVAIILLIIEFDYILLSALLIILLLTTFGNSFIRGSLTCKYCKQRELGCPAYLLFNKEQ